MPYYGATKDKNAPVLTNTGILNKDAAQPQNVITLTVPIQNGAGQFSGLVGCHILSSALSGSAGQSGAVFKTMTECLIANDLNIVYHTGGDELAGKAYNTLSKSRAAISALTSVQKGEPARYYDKSDISSAKVYKILIPIKIENIDKVWTAGISINKSELYRQSNTFLIVIILCGTTAIALVCAIVARIIKKSVSPVAEIYNATSKLANGDFDIEIRAEYNDELGKTATAFNNLVATLSGYINEISEILGEVAKGNLYAHTQQDYRGDFKPIEIALNTIVDNFNATMSEINKAAELVSAGSEQVSQSAAMLSDGASMQASSIEELSASIIDVTEKVEANTKNAKQASKLAAKAKNNAFKGSEYMKNMLEAMNNINEASNSISKIVKVIDDISFQTNILALNASVEAARAGSAGKGFAVVAGEVRTLANKSAEAARETTELISESVERIALGSEIATDTAKALEKIVAAVESLAEISEQIAASSEEQSMSMQQISTGVDQISIVVQSNSATAEQSAAVSQDMSSQAANLKNMVGRFKLKPVKKKKKSKAASAAKQTEEKAVLSETTENGGSMQDEAEFAAGSLDYIVGEDVNILPAEPFMAVEQADEHANNSEMPVDEALDMQSEIALGNETDSEETPAEAEQENQPEPAESK
ncbi:MAG TPA: hypothetical protein DCP97_00540 [Ruminococcaceae bacterium]|nr:hypothetical protein [Oscillospiraceae bacterium]